MIRAVHVVTIPTTFVFLDGLLRFLRESGHEVHAVSSPGEWPVGPERGPEYPWRQVPMTRAITPIRDVLAFVRLVRVLRALAPDVVHTHTPKAGLLATVAARFAGVPRRFYTIHGLPAMTSTGVKQQALLLADRVACASARTVYCVSSSLAEEVVRLRLCGPTKVKVLGHGSICGVDATHRFHPKRIDGAAVAALRKRIGIPRRAAVVGFVGRVTPEKGIHDLVDAWMELRTHHADLHLLVVGPTQGEVELPSALRNLIDSDPSIHLTGFVHDPAPFYAMMNVLALPTYREGFGMVAIEAAAMEVPVVASRVPGCVDAVQDGLTGTLVPVGDPRKLAHAIGRYLEEPHLARQHGRNGRKRALRDFRPEDIYRAVLAEYQQLP